VAIDVQSGADTGERVDQRRDGDAECDSAAIIHGFTVCAAKAKAFMAADPASVPRIAGLANRETCLRTLSLMASWLSSSATNPRSIPTAMAQLSQTEEPVTISTPWARWLSDRAVRVTATAPMPTAVPAWRRSARAALRPSWRVVWVFWAGLS